MTPVSHSYLREDQVPLPPPDATVHTTACDYCIVGCGYKVYTWPLGKDGGPKKHQNALRVDFPTAVNAGKWISPNMHNVVSVGGELQHVVVIPDGDATVVNVQGNHSIRGGVLAQKCFNPSKPSQERLLHPLMRVRGTLQSVPWETAFEVMAGISRHVLDRYGEAAWAMKTYSYGYFENTFAISKLAYVAINTPAYSQHDKPGPGPDTPGLDWAGIDAFSASYEDWGAAEVIYIGGTDPWETKSVLFTSWIMHGQTPDKTLIFALPRKTTGAAWGEQRGGLFLPVIPGTDTVLHLAIARLILENGWEDREFIDRWISNDWEIDIGMGRGPRNTPVEWFTTWGRYGVGFDAYKKWLLGYQFAELATAERTTGVPAAKVQRAAELLAKPRPDGSRPKASFMLEKGLYWCNNLGNTTSFSALGLLCGAGNRPGRVISRAGGHQRGWMGAGDYPRMLSPEKYPGRRKKEIDLDRWVVDGHVRFAWVIGTTWLQAMAASQELIDVFDRATRKSPHQIASFEPQAAVDALKRRVDAGGMAVVDQDIYPVVPLGTEFADLVLPVSGWGEEALTRCNGERRLRLYAKFYDAPGEAKPDWWIVAGFARAMGFKGFDWTDANAVFEESARCVRGGASTITRWWSGPGRRANAVTISCGSTALRAFRRRSGWWVGSSSGLSVSMTRRSSWGRPRARRCTTGGSRPSTRTPARPSSSGVTGRTSRTSTRRCSRWATSCGSPTAASTSCGSRATMTSVAPTSCSGGPASSSRSTPRTPGRAASSRGISSPSRTTTCWSRPAATSGWTTTSSRSPSSARRGTSRRRSAASPPSPS
jgi:arsenite oxidase large subunit